MADEVNEVRKLAVVLLLLVPIFTFWGWLLWLDAGTKHMESTPSTSGHLLSRGGAASPGPDRAPAWVAWAGAAGVGAAGITVLRARQ